MNKIITVNGEEFNCVYIENGMVDVYTVVKDEYVCTIELTPTADIQHKLTDVLNEYYF